ncbi:carboxylesterase family protein [Phenylobacterium sp.]|uniref:carboxylesterase/lipase family protein n=1 Tax=Phenylobacterium sp. TaxID=1871053 RepID=UPI0030F42250
MKRTTLHHLAAAPLALVLACVAGCADAQTSTVDLRVATTGGQVEGRAESDARVFRGLPYAAPPVGSLRWAPPQPAPRWNGLREARAFGPICPQPKGGEGAKNQSGAAYSLFEGPMAEGASEDCLTLNVWAPRAAAKAPVIMFIHAGVGAGSLPYYDGSAFARDGVVMVTINYRLVTLGNFAHRALTAEAGPYEPLGRFGMMDQIAALQWIKANIAAFGGDPDNVTIMGQSAGGAAVLQLLATPSAKGLFHKAIVESGNGWWSPMNQAQDEAVGALLATRAGLPGAEATVEQLRALKVDAMPWFGAYSIDGRLQLENATDAFAAGRVPDVPLMIGWNSFDGSSLRYAPASVVATASPAVRAAYAGEKFSDEDLGYAMYTDSHVGAPARWIAARSASGAPSYLYHFSYVLQRDRGKVRGAAHGRELPHAFDSWGKIPGAKFILKDQDRAVTHVMHACWVAFARTGVPACEGAPKWPRYDPKDDRLMEFGDTPQVRRHFRKDQLDAQDADMANVLAEQARSIEELLR